MLFFVHIGVNIDCSGCDVTKDITTKDINMFCFGLISFSLKYLVVSQPSPLVFR